MSTIRERRRQSAAQEAVGRWLESLELGTPMSHGSLSVVPVYRRAVQPSLEYRPLADGIASGEVTVVEAPQATVPTLRVDNRGTTPVLIIDGEEVVGGRQNRVVNTTVLVPSTSAFDLPVSCVEQGRWHARKATFEVGEAAYPALRRQKTQQVSERFARVGRAGSDQGAIWSEIGRLHRRDGTRSATGAMKDAYDRRAQQLDIAARALACPSDRPVGVIALVGGRSYCADLFDQSATLRAHWPRLVRSYSLDAASVPAGRVSLDSARRLLDRARQAHRAVYRSPGLGLDVRLSGNGIVGAALVESGVVAHAAIFRQPVGGS